MPYKQNIKLQIKNAVERFNKQKNIPAKTHPIGKKVTKKKCLKQTFNYYQKQIKSKSADDCHVLNFYNILTINEQSIRDPNHDESHIKTHFYYKNMKKVQVTENYLMVFIQGHHSLTRPVSEFIARYKKDSDIRFRKMGALLEEIEHRLQFNKPYSTNTSTLSQEAAELFSKLGNTPFIAKIGTNQLAISKSLMDLFGYDSQEFIIECTQFRVPLFEGFSCKSYYEIMMKNLENTILLMDFLNGRIPYNTFSQLNYFEFQQKIISKNNTVYNCKMSLSMPVPLVSIIKLQKILDTSENLAYESSMSNYKNFKQYYQQIRQKEYKTLQHLIKLPANILPINKPKVADYLSLIDEESAHKSTFTLNQSK